MVRQAEAQAARDVAVKRAVRSFPRWWRTYLFCEEALAHVAVSVDLVAVGPPVHEVVPDLARRLALHGGEGEDRERIGRGLGEDRERGQKKVCRYGRERRRWQASWVAWIGSPAQ